MATTDQDLTDRVRSLVESSGVPGLLVGVVRDGELEHVATAGLADPTSGAAYTPDTTVRIASITKTMTAIAAVQLVQDGRFGLDDEVNDHLSAFRVEPRDPAHPPVRVRDLLRHTSGLGAVRKASDIVRPGQGMQTRPGRPMPSLPELYAPVLRTIISPADRWSYSNHGYAVLGQLIEEHTGTDYETHLEKAIFDPLGMSSTAGRRDSARLTGPRATGWVVRRGRRKPAREIDIFLPSAGCVYSTLADMASYAGALTTVAGRRQLLDDALFEAMLTEQWPARPSMGAVGLGFVLDQRGGHRIAWHNGGMPGWMSSMWTAPDDGLAVVAFANALSSKLALDHEVDRMLSDLLGVPERPDADADPRSWGDVCGTYKGDDPILLRGLKGKVRIAVEDGALRARFSMGPMKRDFELVPIDAEDPLLFEAVADGTPPQQIAFSRDDSGNVTRLHVGPGGYTTMARV